jgi:hypothetical protein
MSKKQKLAETRRRIAELQTKLVSLKTAKPVTEKEARFNTGLARLIESELDKAGVVMAAQSIVDKLTKMIEDTAKVYGDEVVPMMDSIKDTFGPDMAENFRNAAQNQLNAATTALTQVKDAIGAEVSKLEGVINGGGSNDMGMADDFSDINAGAAPAPGAMPADPAAGGVPPAPMDGVGGDMSTAPAHGDAPLGDTGDVPPVDAAFDGMDDGSAAGRAKKESAKPKGKAVNEDPRWHGYHTPSSSSGTAHRAGDQRWLKKGDVKKDDKDAKDAETKAVREGLSTAIAMRNKGPEKKSEAKGKFDPKPNSPGKAGSEMSAPTKSKKVAEGEFVPGKKGVNPFPKGGDAKKADKCDKDESENCDKDAKNESARSKATKALAESSNPDLMILNAFKKALREGHSPVRAARAISKVFEVDFADVVEIVRENSLGK